MVIVKSSYSLLNAYISNYSEYTELEEFFSLYSVNYAQIYNFYSKELASATFAYFRKKGLVIILYFNSIFSKFYIN